MNTPARIAITAVTTVVVFATSFLVASALTTPEELSAPDAPLAVPEYTIEQAEVLLPVATGANAGGDTPADLGLSVAQGLADVTVPAAAAALEDGEDLPEGALSPAIVEAAAALDSTGGDASELLGEGAPAPDPSPSAEGAPASDPCAAEDADPETCPAGMTATLFSLDGDLQVWGTADPPTGPGMGSSIFCEATDLPEGALSLGALTTAAADVAITYWPEDDPTDTTTVDLTRIETWEDGAARYCGATEVLEEGYYAATAFAISAEAGMAAPMSFTFDSRGRATVPNMTVIPLGTNWVWVGLYHTPSDETTVGGFLVGEDGPGRCEDRISAGTGQLRTEIPQHVTALSVDWLEARNYQSVYSRVTSALLYVPEGESALICGATFTGREPSWDAGVPDRVQTALVEAPDTWTAVATVREISAFAPGVVTIRGMSQLGSHCGRSLYQEVDAPRSDTATVIPVGHELCALAGQNMQLEVRTNVRTEAGDLENETSFTRLLLPALRCTGVCPEPEPRTYNVFLPRLGQDECPDRTTDDCELRRRVFGARATIDVTWISEGDGGRTAWTVGATGDQTAGPPESDVAQFDSFATVTTALTPTGFSANGMVTLKWDRRVDYTAQLLGTCFNEVEGSPAPDPVSGSSAPAGTGVHSALVNFRNLCPGETYHVVVTYTDEGGTTQTATGAGAPGLTSDAWWPAGTFTVQQRQLEVTVTMEMIRSPGLTNSYLIRDSWVSLTPTGADHGTADINPSFGYWQVDRCFAETLVESEAGVGQVGLARTYDIVPGINVFSDVGYYPLSPDCTPLRPIRYQPYTNASVTLEQLLDGVTIRGSLYWGETRVGEPGVDFQYRIYLHAEYVEE